MGRKPKKVDRAILQALAERGMTTSEMAGILDVSPDTLERRYHNEMIVGKLKCSASVRRKLFEMGQAGNVTALIWLSKQYCGFTDHVQHTGDVGVTMSARWKSLQSLTARTGDRGPDVPPKTRFLGWLIPSFRVSPLRLGALGLRPRSRSAGQLGRLADPRRPRLRKDPRRRRNCPRLVSPGIRPHQLPRRDGRRSS